jgi:hypothetical protein
MLERAIEGRVEAVPIQGRLISPRFARPVESFAVKRGTRPPVDTNPGPNSASAANTEGASTGPSTDQADGALA